jgi:hypothetical protein
MTSDIRPKIAEKEIWDFDVDVPSDQKARLSFSGVENIPAEFKVYLIDRTKLRTIDLRLENQYIFTAITDHCKFAIIIGNEIAVEQELQSIIPMKFVLGSNYPNPFNPETVIPIELPEASEISLKIYNILGEEVPWFTRNWKTLIYMGWDEPSRSALSFRNLPVPYGRAERI